MDTPTITIDMDRACRRCTKLGAAENGLCLECIAKEMATTTYEGEAPQSARQLSLTTEWIDLTDEEKIDRGHQLANLLREAQLMGEQHGETKKAMKEDREALEEKIAALAQVVRTGREERPIAR